MFRRRVAFFSDGDLTGPVLIPVPAAINFPDNILNIPVHFVFFQVPFLFQVATNKKGNGLVKTGIESTLVFLDDLIAVITRLAVDELHQYFTLVHGEVGQGFTEFGFEFFFPGFDDRFPFFFEVIPVSFVLISLMVPPAIRA